MLIMNFSNNLCQAYEKVYILKLIEKSLLTAAFQYRMYAFKCMHKSVQPTPSLQQGRPCALRRFNYLLNTRKNSRSSNNVTSAHDFESPILKLYSFSVFTVFI